MTRSFEDLSFFAEDLKLDLAPHFSADTAYPGTNWTSANPSLGHCAVVAFIVNKLFGGDFVSARYKGQSHWFNRVDGYDIDLTGDQYGLPTIRLALEGQLYEDTRLRSSDEMQEETRERARLLMQRAGIAP